MFVKICGITTEDDALLAVAMGADALGFVLAPSTRQVSPSVVADIVKRVPPEIATVGVFRDQSPERVVETINATRLVGAQLHGTESAEQVAWVRRRVRLVIKGMPAGSPAVPQASRYKADVLLLDAPDPGSGQLFDWRLTDDVPAGVRLMLAGGLTPDNVADAIALARPWGVDVSTGVEAEPGRKDPRKLRAFIAAAKAAAPRQFEASGAGPYDWQDDAS